jgi:CheY-like chemotaxis protein
MAAKRIVDSLRKEGLVIPVLVTTSQSGKTADLLVEKLGASGYLSKPLTSSQVALQLSGFLGVVS